MSFLDDLVKSTKSGIANYFSKSDSPISKVAADIKKVQTTLETPGGLSSAVSKAADKGISKLATSYAANQDNSAKIQRDGSFISPTDSTGIQKGIFGLSIGAIALIIVGYVVIKKVA